ncbi:putative signal peptide protein [Puccinia sorghi]|uniref:Putative signal peptide protein n=1 Tax=Puccinia sorghi TaxID=27349 RepID=A0A0L6U9Y6_9BASI|nr:putative signal peptide protein [Puccinia sorghi]
MGMFSQRFHSCLKINSMFNFWNILALLIVGPGPAQWWKKKEITDDFGWLKSKDKKKFTEIIWWIGFMFWVHDYKSEITGKTHNRLFFYYYSIKDNVLIHICLLCYLSEFSFHLLFYQKTSNQLVLSLLIWAALTQFVIGRDELFPCLTALGLLEIIPSTFENWEFFFQKKGSDVFPKTVGNHLKLISPWEKTNATSGTSFWPNTFFSWENLKSLGVLVAMSLLYYNLCGQLVWKFVHLGSPPVFWKGEGRKAIIAFFLWLPNSCWSLQKFSFLFTISIIYKMYYICSLIACILLQWMIQVARGISRGLRGLQGGVNGRWGVEISLGYRTPNPLAILYYLPPGWNPPDPRVFSVGTRMGLRPHLKPLSTSLKNKNLLKVEFWISSLVGRVFFFGNLGHTIGDFEDAQRFVKVRVNPIYKYDELNQFKHHVSEEHFIPVLRILKQNEKTCYKLREFLRTHCQYFDSGTLYLTGYFGAHTQLGSFDHHTGVPDFPCVTLVNDIEFYGVCVNLPKVGFWKNQFFFSPTILGSNHEKYFDDYFCFLKFKGSKIQFYIYFFPFFFYFHGSYTNLWINYFFQVTNQILIGNF